VTPDPKKKAPRRKVGKKSTTASSRAKKKTSDGPPDVASALAARPDSDLSELFRYWAGKRKVGEPSDADELRELVLEWMGDLGTLEARIEAMGARLRAIFDLLLAAPRYELPVSELAANKQLAYLSSYDLMASITVLQRHGLVAPSTSAELKRFGQEAWAVPCDLGDNVLRARRAKKRGIFDVFALRGHLERLYTDPARATSMPTGRQRELYKMYCNESASVARIERLPDGLRGLIQKVILEFGGLLPKGLFERMEHDLPHWNGKRWGKILEESLVGTVERLELSSYGLKHNDETLIVFNEVALAWLRRVAVPGDPDAPHEEASLGVDLASNISRFIGFILDHNVRFTVRGEIFKTTEKRILQELIPNPGRELARSEVLNFIYGFARHTRLIESTGERTFALTSNGREWEPKPLDEKMHALLDFCVEERDLGGEYFHQARMRRIFLRLLKRVEPGVWYDLMYLPFLSRNTYLSNLDELAVEDYFAAQAGGGQYTPMEDLQRLAWNLVNWVRKRLYLLGIVDLGYDDHDRPVAMRLTRLGARLVGAADENTDERAVGSLVVTPDYEVVLFPTGDDAELVHDLDRFCKREKNGHLVHFRIMEKGVQRALNEGMLLGRILTTLERNSRTPVPQNVLYTIRDWASHAGLLQMTKDLVVRGDNPEVLARFHADPGVRTYLSAVVDEHTVKLKSKATPKRMQSLLRDLGFLVELVE
jgi:hypothetical protein